MRAWQWAFVLALATGGCHTQRGECLALTPARAAAIDAAVRAFASAVAEDVTRDGPAAWEKHLGRSPAFFMAADGTLVFPNRAAATSAVRDLVHTLPHVELRWGEDLRVDPLAENLAGLAASYRELQVDAAGHRLDERGFFTAVVEYDAGRWQFRNAHWSAAAPAH